MSQSLISEVTHGRFFEARKATIMARNKSVSKAFCASFARSPLRSRPAGRTGHEPCTPSCDPTAAQSPCRGHHRGGHQAGLGGEYEDWAEAIYEGYGPHGIAVMVVCSTNNHTRTVANGARLQEGRRQHGRHRFRRFQFKRMGVFASSQSTSRMRRCSGSR